MKENLLACLEGEKNRDDVFDCFNAVIEQAERSDNKPSMINHRDIIRIKNAIKTFAKKNDYDFDEIFLRLWWSRKLLLNIIAAHLLKDIYKNNTKADIESIKTLIWRIDNRLFCKKVSDSISKLVNEHIEKWKEVLKEWAKSDFKWNRMLAILLIKKIAALHAVQIPDLLKIIDLFMNENDPDIQQEIGKGLSVMLKQWDWPVFYFVDKYKFSENKNTQSILRFGYF